MEPRKQPSIGVLASDALCYAELSFSAMLACHLDRFLFALSRNGVCLHQGPVRNCKPDENPEASDVYICASTAGEYGTPVLLGDVKTVNLELAVRETGFYCYACAEVHSQKSVCILCS